MALGTTTIQHADDSAKGSSYDITNSDGYKRYFPSETTITVARALDVISLAAIEGTRSATETTEGIVMLASNADMDKIDVNGPNADPFYDFLKNEQPGVLGTKNIKWNFSKFLVNKDGEVIKRYSPTTKPEDIESDIENLLS